MEIFGEIVAGKQIGRTLGFPTANLRPDHRVNAANGVYIGEILPDGYDRPLPCVVNQGRHPTLPDGAPTIEAHILDFKGDLYGRRARLKYIQFLRAERKFDSVAALAEQLAQDRQAAREYFENRAPRVN